ncbi:4-hydroxythreonine-4-phosphate dehydrogenase PdxA [Tepidanaerobacter sp. GT38]|uniref:4-hydroxythreonine-4-phosphate dehydrogenase PdxA n=1 Tax=Tepidanaerobacter sp. GT38 TaxID=2722793 RepID=UPI001F00B714|nr:4-hydroxythreonine-4-phosphate dehydrogenase PdxA [Tepidanaerobacter sp. GT38]MCG1013091.1 4-hydroxythreonine-4-phosphate dehydrogenase PdxA [Tepidanaerobacter sp. GT38]
MQKTKPVIAITVGDPCGIGPEITAKALSNAEIYDMCCPVAISDADVMRQAVEIAKVNLKINSVENLEDCKYEYGTIDVLNIKNVDVEEIQFGKVTKMGGEASFQYIVKGIQLALEGKVDAVTTGPIHKKAINLAGHEYSGHTEIFADYTKTKDYCMMLVDGDFRVSHVTTHVSFRQVPDLVKKARVLKVIELTNEALIKMGIKQPRIAVAGLNPHSGEEGLFGREEIEEIEPAIKEANQIGIQAEGPVPPDTVFVKMRGGQYDAVVAMYHDQGHIPTKLVGFKYDDKLGKWGSVAGVNTTLGLPIIRTSVDHGVAFGKAGKGTANPESMIDAIKLAAVMAGGKE